MAIDDRAVQEPLARTWTPRTDAKDLESTSYGATGNPKGEFSPRPVSRIPTACWYILVVELCERLAFYTIAGSQSFFLERIGYSLAAAGSLNATMWTLCTVLAVLTSWLADVVLGRYTTILWSGLLYVGAVAIAAVAAWPGHERSWLYFVGVMALLPLATAGIKSNLSNFGADQYDSNDPDHEANQERFFSIFYLSINVGAAFAYGFFTTFAASGGPGVPRDWGYLVAYALMAGFMLVAVLVYRAGSSDYKVHPLQQHSAISSVWRCLVAAIRGGSWSAASICMGVFMLCLSIILSTAKAFTHGSADNAIMLASFLLALVGTVSVVRPCMEPSWLSAAAAPWLSNESDKAWLLDVQEFMRLMPMLFLGSLAFNAVYNPMQFWYQQQACQMDVRIAGFQLSGSFFNIADCLAIVIATPFLVDWLNPRMERAFARKMGTGLKFGIGVGISSISVLVAARLELVRRQAEVLDVQSNCAPPGVQMSAIQGSWMLVPFFLMGIGEVYAMPTLLHLCYSRSPARMRTLATATFFFIAAVSSSLFALLVSALNSQIPNDLNLGHLEYGYFASVAIGVVFYLAFLAVLR